MHCIVHGLPGRRLKKAATYVSRWGVRQLPSNPSEATSPVALHRASLEAVIKSFRSVERLDMPRSGRARDRERIATVWACDTEHLEMECKQKR